VRGGGFRGDRRLDGNRKGRRARGGGGEGKCRGEAEWGEREKEGGCLCRGLRSSGKDTRCGGKRKKGPHDPKNGIECTWVENGSRKRPRPRNGAQTPQRKRAK